LRAVRRVRAIRQGEERMPFVHIVMEPRDEETKHRIGREIADAMAEGTNNSLDGIQMIFHEVPRPDYARGLSLASRRQRTKATPVRADYVGVTRLKMDDEDAYLAFRRDHNNPALARQQGFVSTMLLKLDGEYLLLNKWVSRDDADKWAESDEHKDLQRRAASAVRGLEVLERKGAVLLHQQFGASAGRVLDGSEPALDRSPAAV
jgi:phenylpyruvate tautomerase PptA (4-oxalocrotonate tautomerase family)/heme-degrading monooxygenase HmoA